MWPIGGLFGGSRLSAVAEHAALNVGEQMPVRVPALASLGVDPEVGLLDHRVILCPVVR